MMPPLALLHEIMSDSMAREIVRILGRTLVGAWLGGAFVTAAGTRVRTQYGQRAFLGFAMVAVVAAGVIANMASSHGGLTVWASLTCAGVIGIALWASGRPATRGARVRHAITSGCLADVAALIGLMLAS